MAKILPLGRTVWGGIVGACISLPLIPLAGVVQGAISAAVPCGQGNAFAGALYGLISPPPP